MAIEEKDIIIDPQGIAVWEINMVAPIQGTYQGVFKFRTALSPIQQIYADRDYRELLGKNSEFATTYIENIAYALSQLKQRVISAPPFWFDGVSAFPGSQIKDMEVLQEILEAAVAAENKYRKSLKEKHEQALKKLSKALEEMEAESEPVEEDPAPKKTKKK